MLNKAASRTTFVTTVQQKNCEKKYLKMSVMVLFRANRNRQKKNVSERNMIKNLNWQKANQLAMYKSG